MGGYGSGNWNRPPSKQTVEDCLVFSMKNFRSQIAPNSAGQMTWTFSDGKKSSAGFRVELNETQWIATIHYRWNGQEDIDIPVRLQTSPAQFNGLRWWFTCPLVANGTPCERRVGNLYLPPNAKYFGCRHCHQLAYRSSQRAHYEERRAKFLERLPEEFGRLFPSNNLA